MPDLGKQHWAEFAEEWIAWARSPDHDAFWSFRRAFADYIGPGVGKALEIGCGEGRISRELKKLGYHVTATDPVEAMIEAARQGDSADEYLLAEAADLPLQSSSFDLVVAYNVLMDVEDICGAVKEAQRMIKPGGALFISLVHPFRDQGRFAGTEPDAPFVVEGTYYGRQRFEGMEEKDGLSMHFAGWSQPLENYMAALEKAGLAIVSLQEPRPDKSAKESLKQWRRIPLFLWLKAKAFNG